MAKINRIQTILMAGVACAALSACGADDIASPGEGAVVIPAPTPTPTPGTPTPTPGVVTPAADCPTIAGADQLTDLGTISNGTSSWRNCGFPARFNSSTAIPKTAGVLYSMPGRVDVGTDQGAASTNTDVTLTIDPGVVIFAGTGNTFLAVNRGNKINAVGTASQPIIFTSRENVLGTATDQSSGQWGGVVLLGRAKITDCLAPAAAAGTTACERDTEGASGALYGGANDADNSGRMSYVQIRYSGFNLSPDSELQGLTPSGVGSATRFDHIQMHNSSDDGMEVFGGRPNFKHLVVTGAEDDSFDTDVGYKGNIQYAIAVQRAGGTVGDSIMEIDSDGDEDAVPRQEVNIANFTFIHRNAAAGNGAAIRIRGGADYTFANGLITTGASCIRIDSATTVQPANPALDENGPPVFQSVSMQCNDRPFRGSNGPDDAAVRAIFELGTNNSSTYTPSLTDLFVNGATETALTPFDAKTLASFFDTTAYVGAVADANDTWYAGWTCNSATASFGDTSGNCTDIPVT